MTFVWVPNKMDRRNHTIQNLFLFIEKDVIKNRY